MNVSNMLVDLLSGFAVSVEIFVCTLAIALPLGFVLALGRLSRNGLVAGFLRAYISVVRGTPLMLQILFVYFAPYMLFGLSLSDDPRFLLTILAFSLNYAANFAKIYRDGILAIDRRQTEAAVALGFTKGQAFFRIVLPQVVRSVIPAVGNQAVALVKDTSLATTIAVTEMFTVARQLSSAQTTMMPLVAAGVFYYLFSFLVVRTMDYLKNTNR